MSILSELYENVYFQTILQRSCAYAISTLIWAFVMVVFVVIGSSIIFASEISQQIDIDRKIVEFFHNVPSMGPVIAVLSLMIFQYIFQFLGL